MTFPFRSSIAFGYHLLKFARNYKEYSICKRISIMIDYYRLHKKQRLLMGEYYDYEFEKQTQEFRDTFLGIREQGYYLKTLNPIKYYTLARNKYLAHLCLERAGIPMPELLGYHDPYKKNADESFAKLIVNLRENGKCPFVMKVTESSHGEGVYVVTDVKNTNDGVHLHLINGREICLSDILKHRDELIVEAFIEQTKQLSDFNKTSVNTIRFMTCLHPNGEAEVIATFIKIGRDGVFVDNAGTGGNVDAGVDVATGQIYAPIVFEGFRDTHNIKNHPDSDMPLDGVVIENWEFIKSKVLEYQRALPFVKAAGWDIAITDDGPIVIEVNDSWDRTGQLFIQRGWKKQIKACFQEWDSIGYKPSIERWTHKLSPSQMSIYQQLFK